MAKQRRDRPAPATRPQGRKSASNPSAGRPPAVVDEVDVRRRETFLAAVALYEQGMQALQARDFGRAAALLSSVLDRYPEELDLHERVRLYLKICERQATAAPPVPQSAQERLYAATLALNRGRPDDALRQLESVLAADPHNDHAHYMLALVRVHRNELDQAARALHQAIALNPDNRLQARQDPDLESLRQLPDVRALLDAPPTPDHRRVARSRPSH
ncbi:MAG: tetratricopeptide repeat protein [Acidobacteriota bacterium]|nr:tetratricopeptide repeat protein [Acidobacteriota bacterium]